MLPMITISRSMKIVQMAAATPIAVAILIR